MSTTNHTLNYELSQYIGTDVTSYLTNYNSDMYKIDAQMKVNATDAATAKSDAASAVATSTTAASNASAAVSTANAANTTAEAAQTSATAAQTAAGAAQTDAAAALRASASNPIGNLAPAYDPTLTYSVGDLVTYIDTETNQGKLYKNIIDIDVPEAFNINKWDDVTVSEVIKHNTLATAYAGAEARSVKSILDELFANATDRSTNAEYILLITDLDMTTIGNINHMNVNDATSMQFENFAVGTSDITFNRYILSDSSSTRKCVIDGSGATFTNDTTGTGTINNTRFSIVATNTI